MYSQRVIEKRPRDAETSGGMAHGGISSMSTRNPKPRRERVKSGIYVRRNRQGRKVYEITYRDSDRKQRWETIEGGIRAAEAALADKKARMGRGERVAP